MQKLKKVFTHERGQDAPAGAAPEEAPPSPSRTQTSSRPTGQGSHFAGHRESYSARDVPSKEEEHHPIYDQFTGKASAPEHDTASAEETSPTMAKTKGARHTAPAHDAALSPTSTQGESAASIKSGVMGFPQGQAKHAALEKDLALDTTQSQNPLSETNPDGGSTEHSHLGRDAAIGAGAAGTACAAHQLHRQQNHENLRATSNKEHESSMVPGTERSAGQDFAHSSPSATQQPFERSFQEPTVTTDTDRSFPLAGGVTSRKKTDHPPASNTTATTQPHALTTSEREPGTKEKETGVRDGHGREKLAGAAALAATAGAGTYAYKNKSDKADQDRKVEQERANQGHGALSGVSGAPSTSTSEQRPIQGKSSHNAEAIAAASAAYSVKPTSESKSEHDHLGYGHRFSGDPCITDNQPPARTFTDGPHSTDTANRTDPHLHIPGEFPETPMETPSDQKTGHGGYIPGPSGRHESHGPTDASMATNAHPSTGTQKEAPAMTNAVPEKAPKDKHSHGRDAAIAGGVGAAGLGAYAANKHHQREPAGMQDTLSAESNPYTSTKLDPRVNPHAPKVEDQRFDPTARKEPSPHSASSPTSAPGTKMNESKNMPKEEKSDHHHGRNAALAGAGAATAGGMYYANKQHDGKPDTGPASNTIGPHKSNVANVLDPRVKPDPAQQKHHKAGPTAEDPASHTIGPHKSNVANVMDPRVKPDPTKQTANYPQPEPQQQVNDPGHHYGRDAAVAGGAGAAGYGAYQAAQSYDQHENTQPAAAMNNQRYDPSVPGAHDPSHQAMQEPSQSTQDKEHHYGRNAAVAGGVGAAGAGAYAASKHHHNSGELQGPHRDTTGQTQQPSVAQGTQQAPSSQFEQPTAGHQRYDSVQGSEDKHHNKRDAAALGTAGAVGAAGAYAYSQHDTEKAEKERLAQEKAQQKAHDKELANQRKHEQKELDHQRKEDQKAFDKQQSKQQKDFEKQQSKEQKEHDKFIAAGEKKHQKELEEERMRQQKDAEAAEHDKSEEEGKEKKKHHLFGFLHRHKDKKEKDAENKSVESSPRQSRDLVNEQQAQDSDTSEGRKQRNKLHKEPPKGHPAREYNSESQTGPHDPENKGYVNEPHTGLPMNVGKYGDGAGGTDGSNTVEGYNSHALHNHEQQGQQQPATDWEGIRKANTPY